MAGKKAFGTKLKAEMDATAHAGVFTALADVTNMKPFGIKANTIDATSHDSPGEYMEKLPGIIDPGENQFDLNFDPANATHQWMLANVGKLINWKTVFPGTATPNTASFAGFIKQIDGAAPFDNKLSASCVIDITSTIAWA